MTLTEPQKKYLRRRGQRLRPVVIIGDAGLSRAVLQELEHAIARHELIKVRIRAVDREARQTIIAELCRQTAAILVQRIGNVALVYRHNPEQPRIRLL